MAEQKDNEEKKGEKGSAEAEKIDKPIIDEKKKRQRETILQWIGEVEPAAKAIEQAEPAMVREVEPAVPVSPSETPLVDVPTLHETQGVIEAPAVPPPAKIIEPAPEPAPVSKPISEPISPELQPETKPEPAPEPAPVPYLPPKKPKPVKVKKKPWRLVLRPLFAKKQKAPRAAVVPVRRIEFSYYTFLFLLFIIGYLFSFLAVQKNLLNKDIRSTIASIVPIPYGKIGSHFLWLNVWQEDVTGLVHYWNQQATVTTSRPSREVISQIVQDTMRRKTIVDILSQQYGIKVTENEVDQEITQLIASVQSRQEVERIVAYYWGWNMEQFRRKIVRPYLLKKKVFEYLLQDPVIGRELGQATDTSAFDQYLEKLAKPQFVELIDLKTLEL